MPWRCTCRASGGRVGSAAAHEAAHHASCGSRRLDRGERRPGLCTTPSSLRARASRSIRQLVRPVPALPPRSWWAPCRTRWRPSRPGYRPAARRGPSWRPRSRVGGPCGHAVMGRPLVEPTRCRAGGGVAAFCQWRCWRARRPVWRPHWRAVTAPPLTRVGAWPCSTCSGCAGQQALLEAALPAHLQRFAGVAPRWFSVYGWRVAGVRRPAGRWRSGAERGFGDCLGLSRPTDPGGCGALAGHLRLHRQPLADQAGTRLEAIPGDALVPLQALLAQWCAEPLALCFLGR